ncbi:prepilin peptidase [Paenirhodobacter enshiensis]|uniref:Prepilin type IV endopeptidase peptidase domain-containing protein n=1 Tax=Paenirhodobacter enshiensis TaxID=1105367 RepID=A0A086Y169_9RHOB|nr:prepilin peptidase [Paenirhodobacter enshiensis]KFI28019.1 hypothetical protein CG50_13960 [Paenirhodobacter enshiensis]
MLHLPTFVAALVLLIVLTPICLWVIFTDLKYMKIRNAASLTLLGVFVVVGPLVMPFGDWAWRWSHLAVVLAVGLVLNMVAHFGMGDVKFAAAGAPLISHTPGSLQLVLLLIATTTLITFALHRIARAIPAVRRATPDWESWKRADFPFGLVLATTLWGYYALIVAITA